MRGSRESAKNLEEQCADLKAKQHFRLKNISLNDNTLKFYTGFGTFSALMVCFNFLGPAVNNLNYWGSSGDVNGTSKSNKGRKRTLSPLGEFFLVLVCLCLGVFEQDIAYRFGVSQSTASRLLLIWINFLYL